MVNFPEQGAAALAVNKICKPGAIFVATGKQECLPYLTVVATGQSRVWVAA